MFACVHFALVVLFSTVQLSSVLLPCACKKCTHTHTHTRKYKQTNANTHNDPVAIGNRGAYNHWPRSQDRRGNVVDSLRRHTVSARRQHRAAASVPWSRREEGMREREDTVRVKTPFACAHTHALLAGAVTPLTLTLTLVHLLVYTQAENLFALSHAPFRPDRAADDEQASTSNGPPPTIVVEHTAAPSPVPQTNATPLSTVNSLSSPTVPTSESPHSDQR
jgi:hypothetical protein